jgi:hypothetical protein
MPGKPILAGGDIMKLSEILAAGSSAWDMPVEILTGWYKKQHIARRRMVIAWRMVQEPNVSLPVAGRALNRDHTTILHARRYVDAALARGDEEILRLRADLEAELTPAECVGPVMDFRRLANPRERSIVPPLVRTITPRVYVVRTV